MLRARRYRRRRRGADADRPCGARQHARRAVAARPGDRLWRRAGRAGGRTHDARRDRRRHAGASARRGGRPRCRCRACPRRRDERPEPFVRSGAARPREPAAPDRAGTNGARRGRRRCAGRGYPALGRGASPGRGPALLPDRAARPQRPASCAGRVRGFHDVSAAHAGVCARRDGSSRHRGTGSRTEGVRARGGHRTSCGGATSGSHCGSCTKCSIAAEFRWQLARARSTAESRWARARTCTAQ